RHGHMDLYRRRLGSSTDTPLLPPGPDRGATSWSADGRYVAYTELRPATGFDIWILDVLAGEPFLFRGTPANETGAALSPDGKWIAYSADDSGSWQVYIVPFGGRAGRAGAADPVRISGQTGMLPTWRGDGTELYYQDGPRLMAATLRVSGGHILAGPPHLLFSLERLTDMGAAYAASPDGKRFLILRGSPSVDTPITIRIP